MKPALTSEALNTLRDLIDNGDMRSALVSKPVKAELVTLGLADFRSEDIDKPFAKLMLFATEKGMDYVAG
jgi:hypothetical protein